MGMANQLNKLTLSWHNQTIKIFACQKQAMGLGRMTADIIWRSESPSYFNSSTSTFNPRDKTVISADASSKGLDAVLLQKQTQGKLHPSLTFPDVRMTIIE